MAEYITLQEALIYACKKTGLPQIEVERLLAYAVKDGRLWASSTPSIGFRGFVSWVEPPARAAETRTKFLSAEIRRWERDLRTGGTGTGGGRPKKADWKAYEEAFMEKCHTDGIPNELNVDGWQTQADVTRFLSALVGRDDSDAAQRTVREYAAKFMERARTEVGGK